MKRYILTLITVLASFVSINAMSYEEAREEALYLTDKMAYELNLNDEQYEYAYEINLDYLMGLTTADDIYGSYLSYRNADIRAILYDWQWTLFTAADYFYHPVYWRHGGWYYPIYNYYHYDYWYFDCPSFYYHYHGGHGHHYYSQGYYTSRRPTWSGGFRGHDRNYFGGINENHRRATGDYRGGGRHNNFGGPARGHINDDVYGTNRGNNRGNVGRGENSSPRGEFGRGTARNDNGPRTGGANGRINRSENGTVRGGGEINGRGNRTGVESGTRRNGFNSSTRETVGGDDVYRRGSSTEERRTSDGRSFERSTPSRENGSSYSTPSRSTYSPSRSTVETPSRSNPSTPSRSTGTYSTPSRSTGSYSTPSRSTGSFSTPSRSSSSSSPSRSSGSFSSPSRSSSPSSPSRGGGSFSGGARGHAGGGRGR